LRFQGDFGGKKDLSSSYRMNQTRESSGIDKDVSVRNPKREASTCIRERRRAISFAWAVFVALMTLLCGTFLPSSCGKKEERSPGVNFGYLQGDIYGLPFVIARDKGFLSDEGLESTRDVTFDSEAEEMGAFSAGEIHIGYASIDTVITFFSRKMADVRIAAQVNSGGMALAVRKELGVRSISGLIGRKVAVPSLSSLECFFLREICRKKRIGIDELRIVVMRPDDMIEAISSLRIDAFVASEPLPSIALRQEKASILCYSKNILKGFPHHVIVVDSTFYDNNADLVKRFIKAFASSMRYIKENPYEVLDIARIQTGCDEKTLSLAFKSIVFSWELRSDGLEEYVDFLTQTGVVSEKEAGSLLPRLISERFSP